MKEKMKERAYESKYDTQRGCWTGGSGWGGTTAALSIRVHKFVHAHTDDHEHTEYTHTPINMHATDLVI